MIGFYFILLLLENLIDFFRERRGERENDQCEIETIREQTQCPNWESNSSYFGVWDDTQAN